MTAVELFNALHLFRTSEQKQGISPIELEKMRDVIINEIPISTEGAQYHDVISHTEYITNDGRVEEVITSHDTSRTFRVGYDIDHFDIYLYDGNNQLVHSSNEQSSDRDYYEKIGLI